MSKVSIAEGDLSVSAFINQSHVRSEGSSKGRAEPYDNTGAGGGASFHQDSSLTSEEYGREKQPQWKSVHLTEAWGAQKRHLLL